MIMDRDDLEEKDERQHSDLHWHSPTDSAVHSRISEMKSEDADEPISPGRYNLAFILNSHRPPSCSPSPEAGVWQTTTNRSVEQEASTRYAHAASVAPLPLPARRSLKRPRAQASSVSSALSVTVEAASIDSPREAMVSPQTQQVQRLFSTGKSSPDERLGKKRGRTCKTEGCDNYIVHKGLCCRHGGGKKCSVEGCETSAKHKGLCWKHGGSVECKLPDCTKKAKAKGLCWAHGGGTKCTAPECDKVAISHGCCWAHGGGKRCIYDGCNKPAYGRTNDFCTKHFAELQDVDYYEV